LLEKAIMYTINTVPKDLKNFATKNYSAGRLFSVKVVVTDTVAEVVIGTLL
jgi:hypothetical protein